MENVIDIARWFLGKESMTHKKLQKLCYYAQAWHSALHQKKLFEEDVQAWVHGPVIPALYSLYASYKWELIPIVQCPPSFDPATTKLLEVVYNTYSQFDGDQLEAMSHSEDPWKEARHGAQPWECRTDIISFESMRDYYGKRYAQSQNI